MTIDGPGPNDGPGQTDGPGRQVADGPGPDPFAPVLHEGDPPPEMLASWSRRVLARLLDHALLATVGFLAFPVQPVDVPSLTVGAGQADVPTAASWWSNGWAVGAVVVLLQAYLGSTPGKLVTGVAVVRLSDGRPAGLVRTVAREIAHVLDTILLIGYLRPLWNRRRQTFADSLMGTVSLATRRPLPFLAPSRPDPGRAPAAAAAWEAAVWEAAVWEAAVWEAAVWEAPAEPRWRRAAAATATAACALACAFQVTSSWTGDGAGLRSCDVPVTSGMLLGADVEFDPGAGTERRLWVERQRLQGEPGVVVVWTLGTDPAPVGPAGDPILRVTFTRADGTGARTLDHTLADGQVQPGPGEVLTDGRTGVRLPADVVADLGDGWGADLSVLVDDRYSGTCRVAGRVA